MLRDYLLPKIHILLLPGEKLCRAYNETNMILNTKILIFSFMNFIEIIT